MSATPRNPRYFPRMKVRGARRRQIAPMQRLAGSFDRLSHATLIAALAFELALATYQNGADQ